MTYGAFGVGAVGIMVGVAVGIAGTSKHSALEGECTGGTNCPLSAQGDLEAFHSLGTYRRSATSSGCGLGGWSGALAPPASAKRRSNARLWVGPLSAGVRGAF